MDPNTLESWIVAKDWRSDFAAVEAEATELVEALERLKELGIPEIREQFDGQQKTLASLGTSLTTTTAELRKSLQRQMVVTILGIVILAILIYALPF